MVELLLRVAVLLYAHCEAQSDQTGGEVAEGTDAWVDVLAKPEGWTDSLRRRGSDEESCVKTDLVLGLRLLSQGVEPLKG